MLTWMKSPFIILESIASGYKLSEIAVRSMKEISTYRPRLVIYMGGIVDLTKKNRETNTLHVRHDNIAKMTEEMNSTMNSIRCLLKSAFPKMTYLRWSMRM